MRDIFHIFSRPIYLLEVVHDVSRERKGNKERKEKERENVHSASLKAKNGLLSGAASGPKSASLDPATPQNSETILPEFLFL